VEKNTDLNPDNTLFRKDELEAEELLLFKVEDLRCAIPVKYVVHVIRMAALTNIPKPVSCIAGMINYHGDIIPVFSMRKYFALPDKKVKASDFLIIINKTRLMAIIAEEIDRVVHHLNGIIDPDSIYPGITGMSGVYRCKDGLMVITTPDEIFQASDNILDGDSLS
jgi:purine-binding chemotaxis protein CheW